MLVADVPRVEDPGGRVQRVDRRVDALLRDRPRQHGRRVEVRERGVRRGVGDVVGGDVDRLQRGDRVTTRRGDPLLQLAHLVGQRRLVADRGRHPAEQRRDLGAGLGEPEDVVDEQQHVLLLHVAEVLRHRQTGQRDPQPGARRLVHLTEDQGGVLEDVGLFHLEVEVVALTGALADAGEHRTATELLGDPADHLLDDDGLADTGTAEHPDLAASHVRREQVDDLDPGLEHLGAGLELVERRRRPVDRPALLDLDRRRRRRRARCRARSRRGRASRRRPAPRSARRCPAPPVPRTRPSVGCIEIARTMLSPMWPATSKVSVRVSSPRVRSTVERVVDLGHVVGRELDVDDRADDADDAAGAALRRGRLLFDVAVIGVPS